MTHTHPDLRFETAAIHHDEMLRQADIHRLANTANPARPEIASRARQRLGSALVNLGLRLQRPNHRFDENLTTAVLIAR